MLINFLLGIRTIFVILIFQIPLLLIAIRY